MSTPISIADSSAAPAVASTSTKPVTPSLPVIKKVVRLTREEEERKKKEDALARKKAVDDRFKTRNKRRAAGAVEDGESPAEKRAKEEKKLTPYEREVLEINKKMGLSDGGAGVRSLVK